MAAAGLLCLVLAALITAGTAWGGEFPLWEAGAGAGAISLPDYRGSNEQRLYALPVPYLVYRGEVLRADRKSVRGLLFESDQTELNVSLNASPPVNSKRNRARQGMPDLDPTGEVGPSLIVKLGKSDLLGARVSVHLPVRVVAASDLTYLKQVGYIFNPRINFDWPLEPAAGRWDLGLTGGPLFTDKKYNDYYYAVDQAFATTDRPAYRTQGGYGGFQVTASASRKFKRTWLGVFLRYDDLQGAVIDNSPLVKKQYAIMGGFALTWIIDTSAVRVTAEE